MPTNYHKKRTNSKSASYKLNFKYIIYKLHTEFNRKNLFLWRNVGLEYSFVKNKSKLITYWNFKIHECSTIYNRKYCRISLLKITGNRLFFDNIVSYFNSFSFSLSKNSLLNFLHKIRLKYNGKKLNIIWLFEIHA